MIQLSYIWIADDVDQFNQSMTDDQALDHYGHDWLVKVNEDGKVDNPNGVDLLNDPLVVGRRHAVVVVENESVDGHVVVDVDKWIWSEHNLGRRPVMVVDDQDDSKSINDNSRMTDDLDWLIEFDDDLVVDAIGMD